METALAVFGGLGLGAIISQAVQYLLMQKMKNDERRIAELKEAFSGLLLAHAKVIQNSNSKEFQIEFALWEARVKLVASPSVCNQIAKMKETSPHTEEREIAIKKMLDSMRLELGIAKK